MINHRYIFTILALAGSVLVAQSSMQLRALAFMCWIVSNVCWLVDARQRKDNAQLAMYAFFTVTAIWGLWSNRWW